MRNLLIALGLLLSGSWWGVATAQLATDTARTNVLFEHFSNENYFNIDNIDHSLYQKLSGLGTDVSLIQYQTFYGGYDPVWQDNSTENNVRIFYYGIGYSNQIRSNGMSVGSSVSSLLDTSFVAGVVQQSPHFQLKINQFQFLGGQVLLDAVVLALDTMPLSEYTVFAAVVEREVPTSSGGFYRQHVFRKMLPTVEGDSYLRGWSAGDSIAVNYQWTIQDFVNNPANLGLVFFIQDYNTKEIYQSLSTFQQVVPSLFNPKAIVRGNVYHDANADCAYNVSEAPLGGWLMKLQGSNGIHYAWADAATGEFSFSVQNGVYQLEAVLPDAYWQTCPAAQVLSLGSGDTVAVSIAAQSLWTSPMLSVDVSTPLLQRCATNVFSVRYCNRGSALAPNSYVDLSLDAFVNFSNSSIPATALGNRRYRFALGDLAAGEAGTFWWSADVDCAAREGQTHCTEALISCDSSAILPWANPLWDNSDIEVDVQCDTDSVRFYLRNVGTAVPNTTLQYFVAEDEIMLRTSGVQPAPNQGIAFALPANDATYYIYSEQSPEHPYAPFTAKMVEGCGGNNFELGQALQYPLDDNRPFHDMLCQSSLPALTASDLRGYPTGYSSLHFINNETAIEYLLQFQNRTDDTVFTVFLENRLSPYLDIETLELGASSHPYRLEIVGERTLMFIIENAQLPNVFANAPASRGFIQFRIFPKTNLFNNTLIENEAAIYFDYNPPFGTDLVQHRINEQFIRTQFISDNIQRSDYNVLIYPNPFGESTTIQVNQPEEEMGEIRLRLFNALGQEMRNERLYNSTPFLFHRESLAKGLYLYTIEADGKRIDSGKMKVE